MSHPLQKTPPKTVPHCDICHKLATPTQPTIRPFTQISSINSVYRAEVFAMIEMAQLDECNIEINGGCRTYSHR